MLGRQDSEMLLERWQESRLASLLLQSKLAWICFSECSGGSTLRQVPSYPLKSLI